jgi:hypothetical protein
MNLDTVLTNAAQRIAHHGTKPEAALLEILAASASHTSPGAAAALVDWDGTEAARLRAFAIVHSALRGANTTTQQEVALAIRAGLPVALAA